MRSLLTVLAAAAACRGSALEPGPSTLGHHEPAMTPAATAQKPVLPMGSVPTSAPPTAASSTPNPLPEYLARLETDGDLYARVGDRIVSATPDDIAVLRRYPRFADKGLLGARGERLTILCDRSRYAAGEEVRIVHVHEATQPGVALYVMGPKAIYGEYVDGALVSPAAAAPLAGYDGAVVPSPGADHNYEVSVHRFPAGVHVVTWRFATLSGPEVLESNTLRIEVR